MTTPPGGPARRPLRERVSLIALVLIALFIVAGCALAGWKHWQRSHPGDFTAGLRPCELVSPQTIHRLVPTSYGGRDDHGSCSWSAAREKGTERGGVFLQSFVLTEDLALDGLRDDRANTLGWEKTAPADLPGIGDEAFVRLRTADPERPAVAQVCFRLSNVRVDVTYTRADSDREAARAGAADAAREAADHLKASVR
ncbi:hypothetical protein J7E97_30985 [Streptomyces sp. ISL-66]|uniref:hypothetical protein n=1 Tax=Streptomyces sp. ISL-66 TaxID=2819186 RepID=UPI001BE6F6FD|nr:hypothetical protein [Streptomyces sp. ISL-66]MBT2472164.1 hypothetical protein [Streptomyces sp. ISL-66]